VSGFGLSPEAYKAASEAAAAEVGAEARLDADELASTAAVAVRFMDNVIDVSNYPLPQQEREAKAKRRIGLGITGLADALIMCRTAYGSKDSIVLIERWFKRIQRAAYLASTELAKEKGAFPEWYKRSLVQERNNNKHCEGIYHSICDCIVSNADRLAGCICSCYFWCAACTRFQRWGFRFLYSTDRTHHRWCVYGRHESSWGDAPPPCLK
jgi:ribonucleotide reductase alpha subunit